MSVTALPEISMGQLEWLVASDGHRIPLRFWDIPSPKAVIHILHGMAEHSGGYADVAAQLNQEGFAVAAHDHRCHGLATQPDALGNIGGLQQWAGVLSDISPVNARIRQRYPDIPLIMLGHSMGTFISQHFAQNNPQSLNLLLLEGSSYEPSWFAALASKLAAFECWRQGETGRSPLVNALSFGKFNKAFKNPRTDFDWLSRDTVFVDHYLTDPLCGFILCNGYWRDFLQGLASIYHPDNMKRMRDDLPVYLFAGDKDPVGHMGESVKALARQLKKAGLTDVTLRLYPDARHDILHETNRDEVMTDLLGWIRRHLP